ncbi:MAG: transketolase, partial [Planctomycetota bacterium]
MRDTRFPHDELPEEDARRLAELARLCRGDILKMTTLAGSGHPGGSMSSIEMFLLLGYFAKLDPADPLWGERDRIVTSHGHTSPGMYAALGRLGFFDVDDAISTYRLYGSPFEGHIERAAPGIEWSGGNLGQGLSAACGMAVAARLTGTGSHVYCVMGDGEQQKGQISEARRFAMKYKLSNLTALVDYNGLQLSGSLSDIMMQNVQGEWRAAGWRLESVDGHDLEALYAAVKGALAETDRPTVIIARTVMSKGVSFMENDFNFHGKALKADELAKALAELRVDDDLERYKKLRSERLEKACACAVSPAAPELSVKPGEPRTHEAGSKADGRGAFGAALADIARENPDLPMAVFDCDLVGSVRTGEYAKVRPEGFFQCGIQEHHAACSAGACSTNPVLTWWADFGVFGVDETYNIHRLTDINHGQLKVVCTHCGLDVGEDGKTHQCIDYVGVFANLFGWRVLTPADANQADRAVRHMATEPGSFILAVGRSKLPVIT